MKKITLILLFACGIIVSASAQDKYLTKKGAIDFEASVAAFEPVKAKHESVTGILNTANGEIAALALMRGFRFKVALMEEHFNENYIESEKHPKATFKGKLEKFSIKDLSETPKEFLLYGNVTMRGKEKAVKTTAKVSMKDDVIYVKTSFDAKPEEFDIDIPKVVSKKISETIHVTVDLGLKKK